jgi:hypothetical protein
MTTAAPVTCTPTPAALDGEKLQVYRVALDAHALAAELVPADRRVLRDQLERASLSAVLNISEGAGRRSRPDKRRHYAIARYVELHITGAM